MVLFVWLESSMLRNSEKDTLCKFDAKSVIFNQYLLFKLISECIAKNVRRLAGTAGQVDFLEIKVT